MLKSLKWEVDGRATSRLDRSLAEVFPEFSRARVQALIEQGQVRVDGRPGRSAERPVRGQLVEIDVPDLADAGIVPEQIPLEILYEDTELLVLNKAAGMVVHPGAGNERGTLVNALMGRGTELSGIGGELRPGIVHRLDAGTSGVMVVAKSDTAHRRLAKQFEAHSIERRYLAVVHKVPLHDRGTVRSELGRDPRDRMRFASVESGKEAVTHWECLTRGDRVALVECRLETGRTHQIRVHMTEAGHPLLGDRAYTRRDCTPTANLRERADALTHPLLHARVLAFEHPKGKERLRFTTPPPPDFLEFCALAGLQHPHLLPTGTPAR